VRTGEQTHQAWQRVDVGRGDADALAQFAHGGDDAVEFQRAAGFRILQHRAFERAQLARDGLPVPRALLDAATDARIRYGEQSISPSGFANLRGSGSRSGSGNAWKAIWLRLPDSDEWLLADVRRSARQRAIARMLEGDEQRGSGTAREQRGSVPTFRHDLN